MSDSNKYLIYLFCKALSWPHSVLSQHSESFMCYFDYSLKQKLKNTVYVYICA